MRDTSDPKFNDVNYVFPTFVLAKYADGRDRLAHRGDFRGGDVFDCGGTERARHGDDDRFLPAALSNPTRPTSKPSAVGRISTFVWGIFACIVAIFAANLGSLIEVVNKFGSFFYGSLLGVFVLAFVVKRARARGAFFGLLFGPIALAYRGSRLAICRASYTPRKYRSFYGLTSSAVW